MSLAWPRLEIEPDALDAAGFRSLGLEVICSQLGDQHTVNILDLGAANGSNVAFFSQFPCRIAIEDLYRCWSALPSPAVEGSPELAPSDLEAVMTHGQGASFDLILGWDLFDYLPEDVSVILAEHLYRHSHRNTLLFTLSSTRAQIPAEPAKYTIHAHDHLVFEPTGPATRPSPRHTPLAFEQMMRGFRLLHSFMLRNGIQEYIFSSTRTD